MYVWFLGQESVNKIRTYRITFASTSGQGRLELYAAVKVSFGTVYMDDCLRMPPTYSVADMVLSILDPERGQSLAILDPEYGQPLSILDSGK